MHLNNGSSWNMRKRRRRASPGRILLLLALIGGLLYFYQFVIPTVPRPFVPVATATRSPLSYVEEAQAFFATGKFERAIEAYEQAIRADPVNMDYYLELARIQIHAGDVEGGLENAENAILINPDSARGHAIRGWALAFFPEQGDEAESALVKSLELDPGLAEAHAHYAELLSDQLRWNEAAEQARQALAIAPNSLEARLAMAYVFESTGNYDEAIAEYEKAQSINPNVPTIYLSLGNNYRAQGDADNAISLFQRAIALSPENAVPYSLIAQTYGSVGEYGKASQYAEQATGLDESNPRLHGLLGRMYYHNNELEKSLPELELATRGGLTASGVRVTGLQPGPGIEAEYYYTYGLALVKLERCSEAIPLFELLLATVSEEQDEIAVFNAGEGIRMCNEPDSTAPAPSP